MTSENLKEIDIMNTILEALGWNADIKVGKVRLRHNSIAYFGYILGTLAIMAAAVVVGGYLAIVAVCA